MSAWVLVLFFVNGVFAFESINCNPYRSVAPARSNGNCKKCCQLWNHSVRWHERWVHLRDKDGQERVEKYMKSSAPLVNRCFKNYKGALDGCDKIIENWDETKFPISDLAKREPYMSGSSVFRFLIRARKYDASADTEIEKRSELSGGQEIWLSGNPVPRKPVQEKPKRELQAKYPDFYGFCTKKLRDAIEMPDELAEREDQYRRHRRSSQRELDFQKDYHKFLGFREDGRKWGRKGKAFRAEIPKVEMEMQTMLEVFFARIQREQASYRVIPPKYENEGVGNLRYVDGHDQSEPLYTAHSEEARDYLSRWLIVHFLPRRILDLDPVAGSALREVFDGCFKEVKSAAKYVTHVCSGLRDQLRAVALVEPKLKPKESDSKETEEVAVNRTPVESTSSYSTGEIQTEIDKASDKIKECKKWNPRRAMNMAVLGIDREFIQPLEERYEKGVRSADRKFSTAPAIRNICEALVSKVKMRATHHVLNVMRGEMRHMEREYQESLERLAVASQQSCREANLAVKVRNAQEKGALTDELRREATEVLKTAVPKGERGDE